MYIYVSESERSMYFVVYFGSCRPLAVGFFRRGFGVFSERKAVCLSREFINRGFHSELLRARRGDVLHSLVLGAQVRFG